MIDTIEKLIKSFEVLNNFLDRKLIHKTMFAEISVNITKLKQIKSDMVCRLNEITNFDVNCSDKDALNASIFYLHRDVLSMVRRFDEIREIIEIIIGRYRKLVREQGYVKD